MGAEQSQDVAQPVPQAAWPAAGWHAHSVKYVVRATLSSQDVLPEYLKWLEETHVVQVLALGHAERGEIVVLNRDKDEPQVVETLYEFRDRDALDKYLAGPAITLRNEGTRLFVETGKVSFARTIGTVSFKASR
jgi:hypothetical protein